VVGIGADDGLTAQSLARAVVVWVLDAVVGAEFGALVEHAAREMVAAAVAISASFLSR
jgi:hypothetical protein